MDEDSRKRMKKAFQRETDARLLVKQKSQEFESALGRIIQRNEALFQFRRFVDLYQKIIEIDFQAEKRERFISIGSFETRRHCLFASDGHRSPSENLPIRRFSCRC